MFYPAANFFYLSFVFQGFFDCFNRPLVLLSRERVNLAKVAAAVFSLLLSHFLGLMLIVSIHVHHPFVVIGLSAGQADLFLKK